MFIFELGIGNVKPGASLRAWRDYFFNSLIYGADIEEGLLLCENRIETFRCDQNKPEDVSAMWTNPNLLHKSFDLIVDDGEHNFNSNICFMKNSLHKVRHGGYYICEDLNPSTAKMFRDKIHELMSENDDFSFEILDINSKNTYDNTILVAKKRELIF
jgi:hypothetical protein